ncbi:MAG: DNA repair protein RecO [bacterium]|nr:DNA repair protein RecO [bacterium]
MRSIKTKAVILKTGNYSEKDKMVEIFSPVYGKCCLLAKGANSSRFRFGGAIEVPNYVQVIAYKGKSFFILNHSDLLKTYPVIRSDFNRISLVFYVFDVIKKATLYEQNNENLFKLIIKTLSFIEKGRIKTDRYPVNFQSSDEKTATVNVKELIREQCDFIKSFFHTEFLLVEGLLKEKDKVSDYEFRCAFEEYCGKKLRDPVFI